jgi:hypothetical protein
MIKMFKKDKLLLEFADKIYNDMSVIRYYRGEIPIVNSVSFYHVARARSLLKSICILYRNKQFPDAPILLRALIEVFIRLSWILHSRPEENCRRYADMAIVLRTRAAFKSKTDIPEFLLKEGKRYQKRYEEACKIAKQYGYDNILNIRKWNSKSLADMARETGAIREYEILYDYYSERGHIGPGADVDYLTIGNTGLVPRQTGNEYLLIWAIDMAIKTWAIGCKGMNGPFSDATFARLEFDKITKNVLKQF